MSPASAPASSTAPSLPLPEASILLSSFTNFLTVATHSILYHRKLYAAATFLTARAYNLPVHQSRHPGVCAWIRDAVAAAADQLRSGTVRQIALVIHAPQSFDVLERWIFDTHLFPASWGGKEASSASAEDSWTHEENGVNLVDVNEVLRGTLSRISHTAESRPALPEGCTFTMGVELRDQALAPIQHPQLWIPSQPNLQQESANRPRQGRAWSPTTTTPVRAAQLGPLFFECWVEQCTIELGTVDAPDISQAPAVSPKHISTSVDSSSAPGNTTMSSSS